MRSTSRLAAALVAVVACSSRSPESPTAAPAPTPVVVQADATTTVPADAAAVATASDAPATPADPPAIPAKKGKMTKYDEAVKLLASPSTWCRGAKQLVALEDRRALLPLVEAYQSRAEADKLCLADAMEALGGEDEARKLIASKSADERAAAIRLMVLFASDEQLSPLDDVARHDPDPSLRTAARNALRQQRQTAKWEELIAGYLAAPEAETRGWALDLLIKHNGRSSWQRVEQHLAREQNPELRAKIEAALAHRPK